jgi:hypothetical protein
MWFSQVERTASLMEDLIIYFDQALPVILLYRYERAQVAT